MATGVKATFYKPPLTWAGSKFKLLPTLLANFPAREFAYCEPFLGSGSVYLNIPKPLCTSAWVSDYNPDIIGFYRHVQTHNAELIEHFQRLCAEHKATARYYYTVRDRWNTSRLVGAECAATFLYLNRTTFNGVWRVNRNGELNIAYGDKSPDLPAQELIDLKHRLDGAQFMCGDYLDVLDEFLRAEVRSPKFVYLDPPYDPTSPTANFTSYTKDKFDWGNQLELAQVIEEMTRQGVRVLLSNNDTPRIRELYKRYRITEVGVFRGVSGVSKGRSHVTELLISNK